MTQIALTIHPFFKGTSMLHKVFVAVLVIIAVLCVAKITAQTFHFSHFAVMGEVKNAFEDAAAVKNATFTVQ